MYLRQLAERMTALMLAGGDERRIEVVAPGWYRITPGPVRRAAR
jgi:hypothetical protein